MELTKEATPKLLFGYGDALVLAIEIFLLCVRLGFSSHSLALAPSRMMEEHGAVRPSSRLRVN